MMKSAITLGLSFAVLLAQLVAPAIGQDRSKPRVKHLIDTHIHLYDPTRTDGVPWPPKDDIVLYKPHLPDEFARVAKPAGVTGVVIVEASDRFEDNRWVLDLVAGDDFYVGLVGNLDLTDKKFKRHLKRLCKDKRFVGVRARAEGGIDFSDEQVLENACALARRGLTLDVLPHGISVADCDLLARAVPELRIVVNHALGYAANGKPVDPKWIKQVQRLAENKNVYCKISGLYQHSAQQPAPHDTNFYRPLLDVLWEAFGPNRVVYGSNWPVTKHSGDYASFVAVVNGYFSEKGQEASERYFWKNAAEAYRLPVE